MTNLAHTIPVDQTTHGKGEPVFPRLRLWLEDYPAVLSLINEREKFGISKHGQTLMTGDDRDTPTEIANEMADTLAYLQKLIMLHGHDRIIDGIMLRQIELCNAMLAYLETLKNVSKI